MISQFIELEEFQKGDEILFAVDGWFGNPWDGLDSPPANGIWQTCVPSLELTHNYDDFRLLMKHWRAVG